jgi:hypothetical protein
MVWAFLITLDEDVTLEELPSLLKEDELEVGVWQEAKVRERQTQEIRKNFFIVRL